MTTLGPDWVPDTDGIPHRQAARAVIFSPDGQILLLKGRDGHDESHQWWFTVGGGMVDEESAPQCAIREVAEETGIVLSEDQLVGPVLYRNADFYFFNVHARQDEWFFLVFLQEALEALNQDGRTEMERFLLQDYRWLSFDDLDRLAASERVYPLQLPDLVRRWWDGWDGEILRVSESGG